MANDNKTVAEIVKRVRRECNSYPLPNAAGERLKLVREMEDAHKREIAAKDAEIARLRAAIKPVLEVEVKDEDDCEGLGRNGLTTPCAVCDWWTGECNQKCEVLAVFKAAKECQRIYKELDCVNLENRALVAKAREVAK